MGLNKLIGIGIGAVLATLISIQTQVFAQQSTQDPTVKIFTGEWPPYISQDFKGQGIIPRIITKAFEYSDMNVEYKFVPWKTIYPNLTKGVLDGAAVYGDYSSWFGKLIASDPIVSSDYAVFHQEKREFFNWQDKESLVGLVMGYEKGGTLTPYFQKLVDDGWLKVRYIDNPKNAFELLRTGKIHFMPYNRVSGDILLKESYPDAQHGIVSHKNPIRMSLYRVIFSNKPERARFLMEKLNYGLQIMHYNGEWDEIYADLGS